MQPRLQLGSQLASASLLGLVLLPSHFGLTCHARAVGSPCSGKRCIAGMQLAATLVSRPPHHCHSGSTTQAMVTVGSTQSSISSSSNKLPPLAKCNCYLLALADLTPVMGDLVSVAAHRNKSGHCQHLWLAGTSQCLLVLGIWYHRPRSSWGSSNTLETSVCTDL